MPRTRIQGSEQMTEEKLRSVEAKLTQVEIEVGALKEKVSFFSIIYGKFDETLKRMAELMGDRRSEINEDLKDVYSKIKETEDKLMNQFSELRKEMKYLHDEEKKKVSEIDRWRWMIVGGSIVIGYFLSNVADRIMGS